MFDITLSSFEIEPFDVLFCKNDLFVDKLYFLAYSDLKSTLYGEFDFAASPLLLLKDSIS